MLHLSRDTTKQPSRALYRDPQGRPPAAIQFVSQLNLARPRSCHDTIDCIVTHPQLVKPSLLSRYNDCIVTHSTSQAARPGLLCHDTIPLYRLPFFFSSFTHRKTSEKKNLFTSFFFFLCAIYQAHKSHNT